MVRKKQGKGGAGLDSEIASRQVSEREISHTVKPVLSNHIKQDIYFWLFRQVVAYCCMKVVQKALGTTFIQQ